MVLHVYRPYDFPDPIDPGVRRELRRLGVRFEKMLHDRTDAIVTLLDLRVDGKLLERLPRLRLVANVAVGVDNVDVPACTKRGVLVTNTPDVLTESTADLAWALLLAAARRVGEGERFVRAGRFERWDWTMLRGVDVHGKVLGVVGAGRIGQAVGHRATGFSMQVLYTSRERKLLFEHTTLARRVELGKLLQDSDFVTVHVPLTKETRHLIGARELALMKPTAVLVNTSRGPVVDEAALARALRKGSITAAGLDVYEREPRVHPALLKLENVVLTPHLGSATDATRRKMVETALRNLIAAFKGDVPSNCVNATPLGLR